MSTFYLVLMGCGFHENISTWLLLVSGPNAGVAFLCKVLYFSLPSCQPIISPSRESRVKTILTSTLVNELITRLITFLSDGHVKARGLTFIKGHESVVVSHASCVRKLLTFSSLFIKIPSWKVTKARTLSLNLFYFRHHLKTSRVICMKYHWWPVVLRH